MDRRYLVSLHAFAFGSAWQVLLLSVTFFLPVENLNWLLRPSTTAGMALGCLISSILGIMALKTSRSQLLWVIPAIGYLLILAISLANNLR